MIEPLTRADSRESEKKRSVNRSDGSGKSLRSVIGQSLGVYQPAIKGRGFSAADASVPLADEVAPLPFV